MNEVINQILMKDGRIELTFNSEFGLNLNVKDSENPTKFAEFNSLKSIGTVLERLGYYIPIGMLQVK